MDAADITDTESLHVNTDERTLFSVIESTGDEEALKLLYSRQTFSQDDLDSALTLACSHGYKNLAYALIHLEADVETSDVYGNTPFLICAKHGFTNMAKFLMRRKVNINAENYVGDTALILAIDWSGSVEMVKLLLAQTGIDMNHQNKDGYTALMTAVEAMDIDVIKLLLDSQQNAAEVLNGIKNCRNESAQDIADKLGIGEVVRLLPDDGSNVYNPLLKAVLACDADSLNILMDCQFYVSSERKHIVQDCFKAVFMTHEKSGDNFSKNEEKIIQRLLESGADVNEFPDSCDPLVIAIQVGSYNVCQMLLKHGVILDLSNLKQKDLLTLSAEHGHAHIAELLLKHNPKLAMPGFMTPALQAALKNGHADCVHLFTKHGASVDVRNAFQSAVSSCDVVHLKFLVENFKIVIKRQFSPQAMVDFLISAARSGNLDIIDLLLDAGANVDGLNDQKKTPLTESKNAEVVNFLVQKGAIVNRFRKESNQIYSPLTYVLSHYSQPLSKEKEQIVEALLKHQACVNGRSRGDRTPLMVAVSNRSSRNIIQMLLDHGADVTLTDSRGSNVLMLAINRNSNEILECLLQHRQVKRIINAQNCHGLTALMSSVINDNKGALKALIDRGADVTLTDSRGRNVLMLAIFTYSNEIVECLLQHTQVKRIINAQSCHGLTALMCSVISGNMVALKALIDRGADVTLTVSNGCNVLMIAVNIDSNVILEYLLQHTQAKSMINAQNCDSLTALMCAVIRGSKVAIKALIDHRADVTLTDSSGRNVLMLAVNRNTNEILECLLQHRQVKSIINAQNCHGLTALMSSLINGNKVAVKTLIDLGADVTLTDSSGSNVLMLAVKRDFNEIVECLLQHTQAKSIINAQNCHGLTALMSSIINGNKVAIKALIDHGADVTLTDSRGRNVLMLAVNRNSNEILECLLQHTQVKSIINAKNCDGLTALMSSVIYDKKAAVEALIDHGADMNIPYTNGSTALLNALFKKMENLGTLVVAGSDFNWQLFQHRQVKSTRTDLKSAIISGDQVAIKAFIDQGADVNIPDTDGNTALLLAVSQNMPNLGVLSTLVEAGSDLNWQNKSGYSSLMLAATSRTKNAAVMLLVDSGANVNAVSEKFENETALSLMLKNDDFMTSCAEYLLDHGARVSYLEPTVLLQLIKWKRIIIIPKLIRRGLVPVEVATLTVPHYEIPPLLTKTVSPLCMALLTGNVRLVRYLVGNLFVTQNDMRTLIVSQNVGQYLYCNNHSACWVFLNRLAAQPLSLFSAAFLAVQAAIGLTPGRRERIDMLPLPQPLKNRLGYKVDVVPLDESDDKPMILGGRQWYVLKSNDHDATVRYDDADDYYINVSYYN